MALQLLADADFNGRVTRGVLQHYPEIDLLRVQDVGLRVAHDQMILAWAAEHQRILLSHDCRTMIAYAIERIQTDKPMPGLFILPNEPIRIGRLIETVATYAICSSMSEWANHIEFLKID